MIIGLENPGNGEDNLFNLAEDRLRLLEQIGSPYVRLNYDAGNTVSHRPGQVDPAKDALVSSSRLRAYPPFKIALVGESGRQRNFSDGERALPEHPESAREADMRDIMHKRHSGYLFHGRDQ